MRLLYLFPFIVNFLKGTGPSLIDELFEQVKIRSERQLPVAVFLVRLIVIYELVVGDWTRQFMQDFLTLPVFEKIVE